MRNVKMSEDIRSFAQWIKSQGLEHTLPKDLSKLEALTTLDLGRKKLRTSCQCATKSQRSQNLWKPPKRASK